MSDPGSTFTAAAGPQPAAHRAALCIRSNLRPLRRVLLAAILALTFTLQAAPPAAAHGEVEGEPRLSQERIGPYLVSVWTSPEPIQTGEVSFDVSVFDLRHNAPATDCAATLKAEQLGDSDPAVSVQAFGAMDAEHEVVETHLRIPAAGRYVVTLLLEDTAGTVGSATFDLEVVDLRFFRVLIVALGVQAALTGGWLAYESRTVWRRKGKKARSAALRRTDSA